MKPFELIKLTEPSCSLWKLRLLVSLLVFVSGCGSLLAQQDTNPVFGDLPVNQHIEKTVLEKMWELRLFDVAISQCEMQSSLLSPDSDDYALWTQWHLQTLTRQVIQDNPVSEQEAKLESVLNGFETETTKGRRQHWLRSTKLECRLQVANQLMAQYLAMPINTELREAALGAVRRIVDQAEELEADLELTMPAWSKNPRGDEQTPPLAQAHELVLEIALLKAEAFQLQAQAYAITSDDRVAAATRMLDALNEAKLRLSPEWSGFVRFELAECKAWILMTRYKEAISKLEKMLDEVADNSIRMRVAATLVEAYRSSRDFPRAESLLQRFLEQSSSAELAIEQLHLHVDQLQSETKTLSEAERNERLGKALAYKEAIGQQFGGYWLRRAEALLVTSGATNAGDAATIDSNMNSSGSQNAVAVDLLRIEAKQLLAAKKPDEAVLRLDRASGLAAQNGLNDLAFELRIQAAAVLRSMNRQADAVLALAGAAEEFPNAPKASKTHLGAAWFQSREIDSLLKAKPSAPDSAIQDAVELYREILSTQIKLWPSDEHSTQALEWLDNSLMADGNVGAASQYWLDGWQAADSQYDRLGMAIARCSLEMSLQKLESPSAPNSELPQKMIEAIEKIANAPNTKHAKLLKSLSEALPILFSDYRWRDLDGGVTLVKELPKAMGPPTGDQSADAALKDLALLDGWLRTIDFCRQNAISDGLMSFVDEHTKSDSQGAFNQAILLPSILFASEVLSTSSNPENVQQLVGRLYELDKRDKPNKRVEGSLIGAKASCSLGMDTSQKRELTIKLEESLKSAPRSFPLRFALANVHLSASEAETQKLGINELLKLTAGSKPTSDAWLASRLRLAQSQRRMGDQKSTIDTSKLILASYPELPAIWKTRFEAFQN